MFSTVEGNCQECGDTKQVCKECGLCLACVATASDVSVVECLSCANWFIVDLRQRMDRLRKPERERTRNSDEPMTDQEQVECIGFCLLHSRLARMTYLGSTRIIEQALPLLALVSEWDRHLLDKSLRLQAKQIWGSRRFYLLWSRHFLIPSLVTVLLRWQRQRFNS